MNVGSDKNENPSEKKIKIKILSITSEDKLKLSEITLVDTKTLYNKILKEHKDHK